MSQKNYKLFYTDSVYADSKAEAKRKFRDSYSEDESDFIKLVLDWGYIVKEKEI